MSHKGFVVPPRRKVEIFGAAEVVRSAFAPFTSSTGYVNLSAALEWMPEMLQGFEFEVVDAYEMGPDHGRTRPDDLLIRIREDVYDGMCRGVGRDRFTVAHEFGHLFLHRGVSYARAWDNNSMLYCNSEWQANTFASALLIDDIYLQQCQTLPEVMERFGVSQDAARVRFKK
jgi:Zn-dependent peptidase ImmA (M78 family)